MPQKLTPWGNRILVLPDPPEEFYSEDAAIHKGDYQQEAPCEGEVLAVGNGIIAELTGTLVNNRIPTGVKVLYGKFTGSDVQINGVDHKILREDEVLGIIEGKYERPKVEAPAESPAEPEQKCDECNRSGGIHWPSCSKASQAERENNEPL